MPARPPAFVALRATVDGTWVVLGEGPRPRGLPARTARTAAIAPATGGRARPGERFAAVIRSDWEVAPEWGPGPGARSRIRRAARTGPTKP